MTVESRSRKVNPLTGFTLPVMLAVFLAAAAFATAALAAGPSAYDIYTQARFDLLDEKLGDALIKVEKARKLDPFQARYIYLKLDILKEMKRFVRAETFLQGLIESDPKRFNYLRFDLAFLYTAQKKFAQSLEILKSTEKIDFKRAVTEQALLYMRWKKYAEVGKTLQRLPQQDVDARYLHAQAMYLNRDFAQARTAAQSAMAMSPSVRQARDIKSLMKIIKQAERAARPWQANLSLMVQYDDNVLRNPLESSPALGMPTEQSDFAAIGRFNFSYAVVRQKNWSMGVTAGLGSTAYMDLTDSNYTYWSAGAYWSCQGEKWGVRLPVDFAYYYARSDLEPRLSSLSVVPMVYWDMTNSLRTEFYGLLQQRRYFKTEPDILRWGLGATHFYYFGDYTKQVRLGYRVDQDIDDNDIAGYIAYQATLGGGRPIWGPFHFDLALTYTYYEYDRRLLGFLPGPGGTVGADADRSDNQFGLAAQLFYRPKTQWQVVLGYNYTNNDSNLNTIDSVDPYKYQQNIIWMMFNYTF